MKSAASSSTVTERQPTENLNTLKLRGAATNATNQSEASYETKLAERKFKKERLAGAFRIFSKLGYDEGVAGHITLRDPIRLDCFWVNPYGVAFDLLCVSNLLLLDHQGNIIEGGRMGDGQIYNAAGFAIHSAIHEARPDIDTAAHSHSIHGKAFSMLGRNIDIASHDAAAFAHTVKLYNDFGGVVLDDQEGRNICKALGPHGKAIILQNHGILSAATTVEAAVAYFIRLEKLCEAQLLADATGESVMVNEQDTADVFAEIGGEDRAFLQAQELYEWIDHETGGDYKL